MRIGILTFPNSPSFGAALQMCALYRALENLGIEVEIINYRNKYMSQKKHIKKHSQNVFKRGIISLLDIPGKMKFKDFEKKLTFYPNYILSDYDNLDIISKRYDYLICGSDQVWNPHITGEDLNYFFHFCNDDSKKISYAASFGVNVLNATYSKKISTEIEKFKCISVREEQGKKILSNLTSKKCSIVLDPSMLLSAHEWRSYEKKYSKLPKEYIARFIFNYDKNVEDQIAKFSQQKKLPIVTIGGTLFSKIKNKYHTGPIGPNEWLYILDNAKYVVTDSFHGAAFSIIFHKNLFVSMASTTNSRLYTLLNTFGLLDRVIDRSLLDYEINYEQVQKVMDDHKGESLEFLKKAIEIGV